MELLETWDEPLGEFSAHMSVYKDLDQFVYWCLYRGRQETKMSPTALNKGEILELFFSIPDFLPQL
jgi:hypothetical protein